MSRNMPRRPSREDRRNHFEEPCEVCGKRPYDVRSVQPSCGVANCKKQMHARCMFRYWDKEVKNVWSRDKVWYCNTHRNASRSEAEPTDKFKDDSFEAFSDSGNDSFGVVSDSEDEGVGSLTVVLSGAGGSAYDYDRGKAAIPVAVGDSAKVRSGDSEAELGASGDPKDEGVGGKAAIPVAVGDSAKVRIDDPEDVFFEAGRDVEDEGVGCSAVEAVTDARFARNEDSEKLFRRPINVNFEALPVLPVAQYNNFLEMLFNSYLDKI